MRARTARISDAAAVHRVIAHYAGEGLLLPRTEAEIREHISRFLVLVEKRNGEEKVLGCVALEPYGPIWLKFARSRSLPRRAGRAATSATA
jgi:amino-acid N-acetyltransferase